MATYTTNYNLEKPDASDDFKDFRASYNSNMDTIDANLGSGGGSAHKIVNESGTTLADEPKLQFTDGLTASDDSVNAKTVVGVDTTFTEAVTRTNIASGDSFSTILGKIKKWFSDIPSMFVSKSGDTMTGQLTINNSGAAVQLKAERLHTNTAVQPSDITAGNNTADGTAGADYGRLALYGDGTKYTIIQARNSTSNRIIDCPDKGGTMALTSDLNTQMLTISQNGAIRGYAITSEEDIFLTIPSYSKYDYTATGTGRTSDLTNHVGRIAVISVQFDNNNYYWLTASAVVGSQTFVSARGFGGNSSYTDLDFVVSWSNSNKNYGIVRARRGGSDVTTNAKLTVTIYG